MDEEVYETNEAPKTDWRGIAINVSVASLTAVLSGFAVALGAHTFNKLVGKDVGLNNNLDNVIELKKHG